MHSACSLSASVHLSRPFRPAPHASRGPFFARTDACQNVTRNKLDTERVVVSMAHTVFVYGTLLSEEIVQILLNRNPVSYKGEASHRFQLQKVFLPD